MSPARPKLPHRKTSRRYGPNGGVHYLTFSCYRRLPLLGTDKLRAEFAAGLSRAKERHRFKLLAWVAMPEHAHIILIPTAAAGPDWPEGHGSALPSILIGIKKPLAEAVIERWKSLRWNNLASVFDRRGRVHFWQPGGGFDRNVRDRDELAREVRYIHQNPVRRGLVRRATDWPWSLARWYAGWKGPSVVGPGIDQVGTGPWQFPGLRPEVYLGEESRR